MPDYKEIRVNTVPAYTVTIGPGLLKDCGARLRETIPPCHMAVVTDSVVGALYLETVQESLKAAGYDVSACEFPAGEENKNFHTLSDILEFLAKERLTRTDCLVALGGGVVDPLPEDAPFFVKDYFDYYKTRRGYHPRSLNSNGGWNVTGCMSFLNQPILAYAHEIRSAVLVMHGEKAHSCYFSKDAFAKLTGDNKELLLIPDAVHTDLYDRMDIIPFDKLAEFFRENLK